ncbi:MULTISPECIES: RT0821/Lpp0805 family surface protein [unclassified Rhizobium]|uniref:RT0821/Lpp0805 family surface protein n=1 Tax=unclassified Rhizobium TaxID=2613769 RepID=UPI0012E3D8E9|nr:MULTISPECIES: RT0821/Lpp0805 family surface protein [unclassified Rhizobium]
MRKTSMIFVIAATLPLGGCFGSSMDLFGADSVDSSISTSTVSKKGNPSSHSDELTVQSAVSSVDLEKTDGKPLPWANATTGSAGVVTAIQEEKGQGFICRNFSTTRHSYEGIAYFSGKTCTSGSGNWELMSFDRRS